LFCVFASIMFFGMATAYLGNVFKTDPRFWIFIFLGIPLSVCILITVLFLNDGRGIFNEPAYMLFERLLGILASVGIPQFAGFLLMYQFYVVKAGIRSLRMGAVQCAMYFAISALSFIAFLNGETTDTILCMMFTFLLFSGGIFLGDSNYKASKILVAAILLIPMIMILLRILFFGHFAFAVYSAYGTNVYMKIYVILLISILSFLPQFLGYKIASRRRKAALPKGNKANV